MIKNILFTALLTFSSGFSLLNKAPINEPHTLNATTNDFFYYSLKDDINLGPKELSNVTISAVNNRHSYAFSFLIDNVSGFQTKDEYFYLYTNLIFSGRDIDFDNSYIAITNQFDFPYVSYDIDEQFALNTSNDLIIANNAVNLLDGITADFVFIKYHFYYKGSKLPPLAYREFFITNNVRYMFGYIEDIPYNDYAESVGYDRGYDKGYENGLEDGKKIGLNDALTSDFNAYSWLTGIFSAMGGLLSIQLLPNVSIGGILILIMVLTLLPFLIGLLKGGKD